MYKRETCPSSHICGRQLRTVDVDASPAAYLLNVPIVLHICVYSLLKYFIEQVCSTNICTILIRTLNQLTECYLPE